MSRSCDKRFVDYMGCCGAPILGFTFNLTTCGITVSSVCSIATVSPTVTVSSTVAVSASPTVAVSSSQVVDLNVCLCPGINNSNKNYCNRFDIN